MIIHTQKETFKYSNSFVDFHWYIGDSHLHTHYYYELFVIIEGDFEHQYLNKTTKLHKGDIVLITPKNPHYLSTKNKNSLHANFSITEKAFVEITKKLSENAFNYLVGNSGTPTTISEEQLKTIVSLINAPSSSDKNYSQNNLDFYYSSIISLLLGIMYLNENNDTIKESFPKWLKDFIIKIQNPEIFCLPISQIYELSNYSQSRFISLFTQYVGKTPIKYITDLKINYAKNLLLKTNFSLIYISNELGFSSLSYFITLFKKNTGMTPYMYRKKYYI